MLIPPIKLRFSLCILFLLIPRFSEADEFDSKVGYYCYPYTSPIISGSFVRFSSGLAHYVGNELPDHNYYGDLFKGIPGKSTILNGHYLGRFSGSWVKDESDDFGNAQDGDDFFIVIYDNDQSVQDLFRNYFQFGTGTLPHQRYGVVSWKWGAEEDYRITGLFVNGIQKYSISTNGVTILQPCDVFQIVGESIPNTTLNIYLDDPMIMMCKRVTVSTNSEGMFFFPSSYNEAAQKYVIPANSSLMFLFGNGNVVSISSMQFAVNDTVDSIEIKKLDLGPLVPLNNLPIDNDLTEYTAWNQNRNNGQPLQQFDMAAIARGMVKINNMAESQFLGGFPSANSLWNIISYGYQGVECAASIAAAAGTAGFAIPVAAAGCTPLVLHLASDITEIVIDHYEQTGKLTSEAAAKWKGGAKIFYGIVSFSAASDPSSFFNTAGFIKNIFGGVGDLVSGALETYTAASFDYVRTVWNYNGFQNITVLIVPDVKSRQDDLLGTWIGQGVYYRNSSNGSWVNLSTPANQITAGDLDSDGIDDLIGIWPSQGGVWTKASKNGLWANLSSTADWIGTGDMNGDGKKDLLGSWAGQGVYYRDSTNGNWTLLSTPASKIASGDLDGDGIDDLIGIWPSQGGVWVKYGKTGSWSYLSSTADWIAVGDMNGDGRDDLLGSWSGQGVYWRNSKTGVWTLMATAATQIAAGDLDGDGVDDLIGMWPAQGGVWVKYSTDGTWARLSSTADWISAGKMRTTGASGNGIQKIGEGGMISGPEKLTKGDYIDFSDRGPGGRNFSFKISQNPDLPMERNTLRRNVGPGSPGFECIRQNNLIPGQGGIKRKRWNGEEN